MRCAYCHDSLEDTVGICSGCQTGLHPECWSEAARCPTLGCGRTPLRPLTWLGRVLASILLFLGAWLWVSLGVEAIPRYTITLGCFWSAPVYHPCQDPPPSWRRDESPLYWFVPIPSPSPPATPPETAPGRIQRGPRRRLAA